MTPQERDLVIELFDRLAEIESAPRDREAERVIADELNRAPHAIYALVQTVLVQDEALKAADARIQELEGALQPAAEQPRGFLDSMRESLFGQGERRGSVPSVRSGEPMGVPPGFRRDAETMGGPMPASTPPEQSRGGSFLGTAAAAAAGVVGGAILANSIRSALGGHQGGQGPFAGTFDQLSRGESPWGGRSGGGDLAREAGLDDIGRSGRSAGLYDSERSGTPNESADTEAADSEDEGYDDEGYEDDDGGWESGGDDVTET